jgi:hypothetical protein
MKIKNLMDFLSHESAKADNAQVTHPDNENVTSSHEENVIFIENARLETAREQSEGKELLPSGETRWAD